jgi:hypothetical protein
VHKLAELTGFSVADIQTRRIILTEKHLSGPLSYKLLKIASELLSPFARFTGNGHQMYAYLYKEKAAISN